MPAGRFSSLFIAALVAAALALPSMANAERFSFMALGDMPYNLPGDYAAFDRVIARVNSMRPAFTFHVGDIINGRTRCDDALFARVRDMFATFEGPLVYTPGDNEWTDCHRPNSGSMDPLERLAFVRRMFFPEPTQSLGKTPLRVTPQSTDAQYSKFVENARWERAGVVFATLHIPGSNNNLQRNQAAVNEYIERNAANLAWIDAAFARAQGEHVAWASQISGPGVGMDGGQDGFRPIGSRDPGGDAFNRINCFAKRGAEDRGVLRRH